MPLRIVDVREAAKPIRNAYIGFNKMTTSLVAVVTNVQRGGKPVVGYDRRYGQGGLIRKRFAPRTLEAEPVLLLVRTGDNPDPDNVWSGQE
jgi:hypothetical protein